MSKKKKRRSSQRKDIKRTIQFEIAALILLALTMVAALELGVIGNAIIFVFRFFFGEWYILLLLASISLSFYFMWKREWPYLFGRRLLGVYLITCSLLLLSHVTLFELLISENNLEQPSVIANTWELFWLDVNGETSTHDLGGGMIGAFLFAFSYFLVEDLGTKIVAYIVILIGLALLTGKTFGDLFGKGIERTSQFFKKQWSTFRSDIAQYKEKRREKKEQRQSMQEQMEIIDPLDEQKDHLQETREEPIISNFAERAYKHHQKINAAAGNEKKTKHHEADLADEQEGPAIQFTEVENKDYQLPPLHLLQMPKQSDQSGEYEFVHANAAKLERTFQSFGVKAKVTQVHIGPAVTKYEVHPDIGVKVSKIVNLSDDLALALAAKDIRIEAPIPGKSAIGIEVPNSEVAMVSLREVLDATIHIKPESKLLIALGRDITGEAVYAELNKMPHLLVAGATGSGKSVCINGIITSILMRAKPHEVKLMMIDPKMVELNVYNGIPHLLAPVVTDAKKASQALKKVVSEMERRYELFSHTGTRNIEGYNELVKKQNADREEKQPLLPYIVVLVDELADLMMVASNDVEDSITRLAQMARAAGIHLIIATQRPSVDVITGVIKANIPSRIAFAVSSQTDSRTILDMGGAEKLLGRGDMLFLPVGAAKPTRIQGAFMSDEEVEEVVDFVISQQKAQYNEDMIPEDIVEEHEDVDDELYEDAVDLVVEMQTASVSMLQRRFRIGYTRAARLIDEMEVRGIVGPYEGSKPRAVLVSKTNDEATPS
ncbi:DNA translocase FtsK [Bacillus litorisediminis]|uniref:DNA translocase FtsK n=1 Tax=Bacillus litorisediminis TaxID=2922713 RepID=UPI001FB00185|nr:DNA translocase FtsK [Bacillus litorisediminis]